MGSVRPGRRSSSSGRAVPSTRSGTSRTRVDQFSSVRRRWSQLAANWRCIVRAISEESRRITPRGWAVIVAEHSGPRTSSQDRPALRLSSRQILLQEASVVRCTGSRGSRTPRRSGAQPSSHHGPRSALSDPNVPPRSLAHFQDEHAERRDGGVDQQTAELVRLSGRGHRHGHLVGVGGVTDNNLCWPSS